MFTSSFYASKNDLRKPYINYNTLNFEDVFELYDYGLCDCGLCDCGLCDYYIYKIIILYIVTYIFGNLFDNMVNAIILYYKLKSNIILFKETRYISEARYFNETSYINETSYFNKISCLLKKQINKVLNVYYLFKNNKERICHF